MPLVELELGITRLPQSELHSNTDLHPDIAFEEDAVDMGFRKCFPTPADWYGYERVAEAR